MHYAYIKRAYGAEFHPGDGVLHRETGRDGVVVEPNGHEHYVHVNFGDERPGLCHPHALKIMRRGSEWSAARALLSETTPND